LAVKAVGDHLGYVLTFDDITQQLADQRSAAWADVARRVAHEIKNPLTPIQLAAERLKRRFAKGELGDLATSERLTDTIIRQVGDLRRMVDEFSSFARMPKPVFRNESLVDICRQSVFLHEVAHPDIDFTLDAPDPAPAMVCDRRQLGQAMTNVIKNGIEAIEQKGGSGHAISVAISAGARVIISVADSGIGLPAERERIVEPYMTTRRSGTGLGLAIVKKIVEEHGGAISFADNPGGGTIVSMEFDPANLAGMATGAHGERDAEDKAPRMLTPAGGS
jgi:two-component system, NtrC family, nitrogen regulation sensor histidine kinase NtrY